MKEGALLRPAMGGSSLEIGRRYPGVMVSQRAKGMRNALLIRVL
jgi:hypothetical protein